MSRSIVLAIEVAAEPSAVFEAIITTQGLASFWTPNVSGSTDVGGSLSFGFSEAPVDLEMTVTDVDGSTVAWACSGPWPGWAETTVTWSTAPSDAGTVVVFRHDDWDDGVEDPVFGSVALTWAMVLQALKAYAETGVPAPALA